MCRLTAFNKHLVPTARLELAQLSPLPPQDSVSTNFTTSAVCSFGSMLTVNRRKNTSHISQKF